jgi:hypothetical protein
MMERQEVEGTDLGVDGRCGCEDGDDGMKELRVLGGGRRNWEAERVSWACSVEHGVGLEFETLMTGYLIHVDGSAAESEDGAMDCGIW